MSSDSEEETASAGVAAKVAAASSSASAKKAPRGKAYTLTEDILVCKAFIKASQDKKGVKMKASVFKGKLEVNYQTYAKEQAKEDAAQRQSNNRIGLGSRTAPVVEYPFRNGESINSRFKTVISPACMKFRGVLEVTSDGHPKYKTGDNDDKYIERMLAAYKVKHGEDFQYFHCYDILSVHPKWWQEYIEEEEKKNEKKKSSRPRGTKKMKEKEKEEALMNECLKKAGLSSANAIDVDGDAGDRGGNESSTKQETFAAATAALKQITSIFPVMMGSMMGASDGSGSALISDDQKRAFANAQLRLQQAQIEKEALDLEEENERRRNKKQKTEKDDLNGEEESD